MVSQDDRRKFEQLRDEENFGNLAYYASALTLLALALRNHWLDRLSIGQILLASAGCAIAVGACLEFLKAKYPSALVYWTALSSAVLAILGLRWMGLDLNEARIGGFIVAALIVGLAKSAKIE